MAKLPDATVLGGLSIGSAARPISTFDTTGYARGAAAIGQGAADLGKGISSLGKDIGHIAQHEARQQANEAQSIWGAGKVGYDADLHSDNDYKTLEDRYSTNISQLQQTAASKITDPAARERWLTSIQPQVAHGIKNAEFQAFKQRADESKSLLGPFGEDLVNNAMRTTDPVSRAAAITAYNSKVDVLVGQRFMTSVQGLQNKRAFVQTYATADAMRRMDSGDWSVLDEIRGARGDGSSVLDRIIGNEGDAKNPKSSADGVGQFVNGTWLDVLKRNRPDLVQGKSDQELLKLRSDPTLARSMTETLRQENITALQSGGLNQTPGAQYLAHFLGAGGASSVLKSDPNTPVSEIVSAEAIAANPSILRGKTAGQVAAWADGKMVGADDTGGAAPKSIYGVLPPDRIETLVQRATLMRDRATVKAASARAEIWESQIIDAGAGKGTLPNRADIENDPALDEKQRNTLKRQYDAAAGDVVGLQRFMTQFRDPNAGAFNPYDGETKKYADKAYTALGGDLPALQAIVIRTGMVPKSAAVSLRGSLVSNDPKRVADALTVSSNLLSANPNAFVGVDGKSEFENNAVAFRTYVDDLGMTADQAAKKIIEQQTPEYQANVKARIKTEDIDAKIKKELVIGNLEGAFDPSWGWERNPKVGFDPKTRQEMFSQYAEQVKERYLETGDMNLAKKQAAKQVGVTWGVTNINGAGSFTGGGTVVQYPVERAPVYAGIENVSEKIAVDAIQTIKQSAGADVARGDLWLMPITKDRATAAAYKSGQPVPYQVWWRDKDGVAHMLQPGDGKAFVPDPVMMRDAQSDQRRNALDKGQADAAPALDARAMHKAQQQASRKALAGRDTSKDIQEMSASRASAAKKEYVGIPADSPEARGLPGGGEALSKNVSGIVDKLKSQPIFPGDGQ